MRGKPFEAGLESRGETRDGGCSSGFIRLTRGGTE